MSSILSRNLTKEILRRGNNNLIPALTNPNILNFNQKRTFIIAETSGIGVGAYTIFKTAGPIYDSHSRNIEIYVVGSMLLGSLLGAMEKNNNKEEGKKEPEAFIRGATIGALAGGIYGFLAPLTFPTTLGMIAGGLSFKAVDELLKEDQTSEKTNTSQKTPSSEVKVITAEEHKAKQEKERGA